MSHTLFRSHRPRPRVDTRTGQSAFAPLFDQFFRPYRAQFALTNILEAGVAEHDQKTRKGREEAGRIRDVFDLERGNRATIDMFFEDLHNVPKYIPTEPVDSDLQGSYIEGINLTEEQAEIFLPHFTMLMLGKPGAGKTTLLEALVGFLFNKLFNEILVVSPSVKKMHMPIRKSNKTDKFDIEWIFDKIHQNNEEQFAWMKQYKIQKTPHTDKTITREKIGQNMLLGNYNDKQSLGEIIDKSIYKNRYSSKPRLQDLAAQIKSGSTNFRKPQEGFFNLAIGQDRGIQNPNKRLKKSRTKDSYKLSEKVDKISQFSGEIQELYNEIQDESVLQQSKKNMLIVLDDVVSDVKDIENHPSLARLFLNRRHLIANGTISIVIASQKYTMIPSRIRSNANWVVSFKQNPKELDKIQEEQQDFPKELWDQAVTEVFGDDIQNHQQGLKQSDNVKHDFINIQIDKRRIFKNLDKRLI